MVKHLALVALVGLAVSVTPSGSASEGGRGSPPLPEALVPRGEPAEPVVGDAALDRISALFVRYDPDYPGKIAARRQRFEALAERLFARAEAGHDTRCSRQIFLEAKWLLGYTAWWPRIDARLDDLEASLAVDDQSFAAGPSPGDGFYARCATEMFIRIEDTLVNYFNMADLDELPPIEREPIEAARTEEGLASFMGSHLVSDIASTGEDYRSRWGGLLSIAALANRSDAVMELLRSTARGSALTPERLAELRSYFDAMVDGWQDPASGYWGAWYRDGERVFKTTDLSITYHIVHARRGRVRYWPELLRTTFAIREQAYPFGWRSGGHWTNHNDYDLARLFRYGWPHMDDLQRRETARTLQAMVDWSFSDSVRPDYRGFRPDPKLSDSLGAEFYFGVSFLVAADFFAAEPWYGTLERPAAPREVCLGMTAYGAGLGGPMAVSAVRKLQDACKAHI
jgi:hypothetical protein